MDGSESGVSRRDFLRAAGLAGALGVSGSLLGARAALGQGGEGHGANHGASHGAADSGGMAAPGGNGTVGDVDLSKFDPSKFLRQFYWGEERTEGGRTVREYELSAEAVEVEVAPGVMYPAWAYNGQVPGPTLRAREGDLLRVVFKNRDAHPHTIHFHGFHPAGMDGVFELVGTGQEFVYEFDAEPFGMHLYHCHTMPLKKHIEKGLYGAFVIDPKEGREEADELVERWPELGRRDGVERAGGGSLRLLVHRRRSFCPPCVHPHDPEREQAPPALALAEMSGASGTRVIEAYVIGWEINARLRKAVADLTLDKHMLAEALRKKV